MPEPRLQYLFHCYVYEKCSPEEEKELMELLAKSENEQPVQKLLEKLIEDTGTEIRMPEQAAATVLQSILQKDKAKLVSLKNKKTDFRLWLRVAAAAIVILFISGVSYWILNKENKDKVTSSIVSSQKTPAILPGWNHAVLKSNTIVVKRGSYSKSRIFRNECKITFI